jgi:hypothetical protein
MFFENRSFFVDWTIAEIKKYKAAAESKGMDFSVRINGTSDLSIETMRDGEGKNILQIFPDVQFYDYTKVFNRLPLTKKYPNYHLTFSYSGANMAECMMALMDGYNVAMVFNNELPENFMGYPVVNADDSDLRYLDEAGVICGLVFKKVRNKTANINNSFVVNTSKEDKYPSLFTQWVSYSDDVIKTKEGYKCQLTQYQVTYPTLDELYTFYKKEFEC